MIQQHLPGNQRSYHLCYGRLQSCQTLQLMIIVYQVFCPWDSSGRIFMVLYSVQADRLHIHRTEQLSRAIWSQILVRGQGKFERVRTGQKFVSEIFTNINRKSTILPYDIIQDVLFFRTSIEYSQRNMSRK